MNKYVTSHNNYFEIVHTGRLDDLIEFVTTQGFSEEDLKLLGESYGADGDTSLLITKAHSFKPMFKYMIKWMNAPIALTGRFLSDGKEYLDVSPLLAAKISNQHFFVEYLIERHKIGKWLGQGEEIIN